MEGDAAGPTPPRRGETLLATLKRYSRLWGFGLFLLFVVVLFRAIVLPFIFATILAYLLAPVIRRLEPRMGRPGSVILVYLVILALLAVFFGLLLPAVLHDFGRLREAAPNLVQRANEEWLPRASEFVEATVPVLADPPPLESAPVSEVVATPLGDGSWRVDLETARFSITETGEGTWRVGPPDDDPDSVADGIRHLLAAESGRITTLLGSALQHFVAGVASFLTKFVITFMIAAFILVDLEKVNGFIRSLVPVHYRDAFDEIMRGMDKGLAGVIRGQLLICLVNGVLTFFGLVLFGIKYSFLLALIAGVFSLIPIFGTIISSIPIVVIALVSDDAGAFSPDAVTSALSILAWIIGIHLLEGNFLNPKIIGDSAQIHPVVVVFALLAGEHVYGLVGALLAVPTVSMVQTIFLFARRRAMARRESSSATDDPP